MRKGRASARAAALAALLAHSCAAAGEPSARLLDLRAVQAAEDNARDASEGFARCRRYLHGWLALADPATGLFPRNTGEGRDLWKACDNAADNLPFLVLSARFTDPETFERRMLPMLAAEKELTSRVGPLPDDFAISRRAFANEEVEAHRVLFGAAEYVKDGLLPLTEWLGPGPWSERMVELLDAIWAQAGGDLPGGRVPTDDIEVHGDLLQALSRAYWMTGEEKYLDWALRLGDGYLLSDRHPARADRELRLRDHGNEVVSGLCELYATASFARPAKREQYQEPLHELLDRLLEVGRNEDGLFYDSVHPRTGQHSTVGDSFGYVLNAYETVHLVDGVERYREAVVRALAALLRRYHGFAWEGTSADGYADAIEGTLNLLAHESVDSAAEWIDQEIRVMWAKQRQDGVIEGWHGDGNFARTTLMYCLWKARGAHVEPWREDVRLGAVESGSGVLLVVSAMEPWKGRLVFDGPRHRETMRLPLDWARINRLPEWFVVERGRRYALEEPGAGARRTASGEELRAGLALDLAAGQRRVLAVRSLVE